MTTFAVVRDSVFTLNVEIDPLRETFGEQYTDLMRFAYVLVGNAAAAEDLAQEAFLRLLRSWTSIRDHSAVGAWLRTTVVRMAMRSRRRAPFVPVDAGWTRDLELGIDVLRAVRVLPMRQRACVALRYLEDRSEAETARLLGISVGSVKSHTHRALRRLEGLLSDDEH